MNRDNLRMFEVANWILLTIAIVTGSLLLSVISLVSLIIELVLTYNYYKNHDE